MKILLVDDSLTMRRILKNTLEKAGFDDLLEADNGKTGLEVLAKNTVDLILLDWNMPQMTGIQFLQTIKTNDKLKNVPVIMVTSMTEKEKVLECIKAGASDYIAKPFTPEVIKEKIGNLGI